MSSTLLLAAHAAVLAYAAIGGLFLAFSDFLMRSLKEAPGGPEVMQAINRDVFRGAFMPLFLGPAAAAPVLGGAALLAAPGAFGTLTAAAALVYAVGVFGTTAAFNVPFNERLARLDPSAEGTDGWFREAYVPRWTGWNTVRSVAALVAASLQLAALGVA